VSVQRCRKSLAALAMCAVAVLFPTCRAVAQSPPSKEATTWQDLGFNQLPEDFSTDEIPLFEGLNNSRGTWSFNGEHTDGEASAPRNTAISDLPHSTGEPRSVQVSVLFPKFHVP